MAAERAGRVSVTIPSFTGTVWLSARRLKSFCFSSNGFGSAEDLRVNVGDTVRFALDEYNVEESDKALLGRQAAWLQRYPAVRVSIEGHADERGTREYNLALGARRANAVKEYLVSQGVSTGRVETVSYGKERPVCTSSDEGCWSQNRRGVTIVSGGANS